MAILLKRSRLWLDDAERKGGQQRALQQLDGQEGNGSVICEERTRLLSESRARFREYLLAANDLRRTSTLARDYGSKLANAKRAESALGHAFEQLDRHIVEHRCRQ